MRGIDLNKAITFKYSSLRYFSENEHHVTRLCKDDVLLLVFDGILRFSEDGIQYEIHPGEYHIQKHNSVQGGELASSSPKYLYVHFYAHWDTSHTTLPFKGSFDYLKAKPLMEELNHLSHSDSTLLQKTSVFFTLLSLLKPEIPPGGISQQISEYLQQSDLSEVSLDSLCHRFNFSKNHMINIFKKSFSMTPVNYINNLKLNRAKYLLEVTSDSIESIASASGFNDYSHFYKLFYRENGISPIQWRSRKHIEPAIN